MLDSKQKEENPSSDIKSSRLKPSGSTESTSAGSSGSSEPKEENPTVNLVSKKPAERKDLKNKSSESHASNTKVPSNKESPVSVKKKGVGRKSASANSKSKQTQKNSKRPKFLDIKVDPTKVSLKNSFSFPVKHIPNLNRRRDQERCLVGLVALLFLLFFFLLFIYFSTTNQSIAQVTGELPETNSPTFEPTHPTTEPTKSPTSFPYIQCNSLDDAYTSQFYFSHYVSGFNAQDVALDPQLNPSVKEMFEQKVRKWLPGIAPSVYMSQNSNQQNVERNDFLLGLSFCNVTTVLLTSIDTQETDFIFSQVTVEEDPLLFSNLLVNTFEEYKNLRARVYVEVRWPEVDLLAGKGGTVADNLIGDGVTLGSGVMCKDVVRNEDDPPRYTICTRQIYLSNTIRFFEIFDDTMEILSARRLSSQRVFTFLTLTNEYKTETSALGWRSSFRGKDPILHSVYNAFLKTQAYYSLVDELDSVFYDVDKSELEISQEISHRELQDFFLFSSGVNKTRVHHQNAIQRLFTSDELVTLEPFLFFSMTLHDGCTLPTEVGLIDFSASEKIILETCLDSNVCINNLPVGLNLSNASGYKIYDSVNDTQERDNKLLLGAADQAQASVAKLVEKMSSSEFNFLGSNDCIHASQAREKLRTQQREPSFFQGSEIEGVIVLLADDLGKADVSIYDKLYNIKSSVNRPETKAVDKIASESILFTNLYSNSPVCSPSRGALLTGKHPFHKHNKLHGAIAIDNSNNKKKGTIRFLGEDTEDYQFNLNHAFKANGFSTAHFGKWHLGFEGIYPDDEIYGLDQFYLYAANPLPEDRRYKTWDGKTYDTHIDNTGLTFPSYSSDLIMNRTMDFIQNRIAVQEKYFVQVALHNSHAPLNTENIEQDFEDSLSVYKTLVEDQDNSVGNLIEFLESYGKLDKTLVLFVSDNGAENDDRYFNSVGNRYSHQRGHKRSLYEGGIQVPGVLRIPNVTQEIIDEPFSFIDLFPTFVGLLNLSIEEDKYNELEGIDRSCRWVGSCENLINRSLIFEFREPNAGGSCESWGTRFAVRYGDYKVMLEPTNVNHRRVYTSTSFARTEIYNLKVDPEERTNLASLMSTNAELREAYDVARNLLISETQKDTYDISLYPESPERKDSVDMYGFLPQERCELFR
eukprot:augustus_masked-scaffold_13-processed-gene-9.9-mRNA-1 protein AED:1.00 eAED:1.00 QI:0/-1/0/0/-1/1/1/0/1146